MYLLKSRGHALVPLGQVRLLLLPWVSGTCQAQPDRSPPPPSTSATYQNLAAFFLNLPQPTLRSSIILRLPPFLFLFSLTNWTSQPFEDFHSHYFNYSFFFFVSFCRILYILSALHQLKTLSPSPFAETTPSVVVRPSRPAYPQPRPSIRRLDHLPTNILVVNPISDRTKYSINPGVCRRKRKESPASIDRPLSCVSILRIRKCQPLCVTFQNLFNKSPLGFTSFFFHILFLSLLPHSLWACLFDTFRHRLSVLDLSACTINSIPPAFLHRAFILHPLASANHQFVA